MDFFIELGGLPRVVTAKTRTTLHKIEVEDEACAFLEYENGAWGYYYTTTCEAGGGAYLELTGDKGKLVLRGGELRLYTFSEPLSEFIPKAADMWAIPEVKEEQFEIASDTTTGSHSVIIRNFARAILGEEPLLSPGEDGLKTVEFINAIILSGKKEKPVEVPVDREEYDSFIKGLGETSKLKKLVKAQRVTDPRFSE